MPRKLKTFQTSLGFYDLAIAAPSMKAALEAWGAGSNLFHQGFAKETDDPDVIAATMAKPGAVLKIRPARTVGSRSNQTCPISRTGGRPGERQLVRSRSGGPLRRSASRIHARRPRISNANRNAGMPNAARRRRRAKKERARPDNWS